MKYQSVRSRNERHKNVYRVYIKGSKAVALMRTLYSFMGKRRQEQIDKVLNSYNEIPHSRGMNNPNAKLTEAEATEIKRRLTMGEKVQNIAQEFHVSVSIVREIKLGRTWKHIVV